MHTIGGVTIGSRCLAQADKKSKFNNSHDGSTEVMIACDTKAKLDTVFHLESLLLLQHATKYVEPLIASNVLFDGTSAVR